MHAHSKDPAARRGWFARAVAWLCAVPVPDAVDRRNALMLQLLVVFSFVYAVLSSLVKLGPSLRFHPVAITLVAVNCLAMTVCFVLLRRGAFVGAARLFVPIWCVLIFVGYAYGGLGTQVSQQLTPLLPLVVGALMLSRRALWWAAAAMVAAVLCGAWRNVSLAPYDPNLLQAVAWLALRMVLGLLLIVLALDFSVAVLRESLQAARERGDALLRARDRLQLEMQEKERSREQLLHSQRMETAGRLAGGIAHDFNHLLGLILAYTARRNRSNDVDELRRALEGAESAARRAAAVSRKLLDFTRNDDSRPELLELGQALTVMRPMLRQLFDPKVAVELDLADTPAYVWLDRAQLELMVLSMAANASDAMPDGGRFRLALRQSATMVELEAGDTGQGMSEEALQRCLEPFFTTKPRGQGTGLGLATTHALVQAAGGGIDVESAPGAGTRLRIRLPACSPEQDGAAGIAARLPRPGGGGESE
ncbi:MAG: ATP-binding protein [Pseudoxanthomonas sp.]